MRSHNRRNTRRIYAASLLIAALGALIAGSASAAIGPETAGAQAATARHTRFIYVANRKNETVSEYRVDPIRGITSIGAIATGANPTVIRTDPTGPYAYVLERGQHGKGKPVISEFRIGARGRLHKIGKIANSQALDIAIGPEGRRLYAADNAGAIYEYAISPHGILNQTRTIKVAPGIREIGIAAAGRYFIGLKPPPPRHPNAHTSAIYEYKIAHDGTLSAIGTYLSGENPRVAMDPAGSYFYVANVQWHDHKAQDEISEYAIRPTGALISIGTVPLTNGIMSIAVSRNGKYLSVASVDMPDGAISQYTIQRNGRLKRMAHGPTHLANAIAVGSNGDVYATIQNHNTLSEYVRHPDGKIVAFGTISARLPNWILTRGLTFDSTGRYAYLVHVLTKRKRPFYAFSIFEYTVGPHGLLTKLPGAVSTPSPSPIHAAAGGRYAYQIGYHVGQIGGDHWIIEYRVGPQGHLVSIGSVPTTANVNNLSVDPVAPYLYADGNSVEEYAIGPRGHLQKIGSLSRAHSFLVIGPAGRHLYARLFNLQRPSGKIQKYDIGAQGLLARPTTKVMTTKEDFNSFVIDPTGRYAYGVDITHWSLHGSKGQVVVYAVKHNGDLREIERSATLRFVKWPRIDPQGRFLYLASNGGHNRIAAYRIPPDGRPVFIGKGFPGIYAVDNMTMGPTGKYLYVAGQVSTMDASTLIVKAYSVYSVASIGPNGRLSVMGACAAGAGHGPSSVATTHY